MQEVGQPVIPAKPLNKVEESAAEAVEGRGLTEGKAEQQNTSGHRAG
jgi:hypothetical protein